jgi:aminoglycoside phosphotransferase (APT) family kinase protein
VEIEPQPRWRRGWYVTATRNGTTFDLYLRGDRDSTFNSLPFEIEAQYHEILERHGIPVPHVYGVCSDPRAIVMDLIPGSRDISALSPDGQKQISEEYVQLLVRIHEIDPAEFEKMGLWRAETPGEASLRMMAQ